MRTMEGWEKALLALYAEAVRCGSFAEVNRTTLEMEKGEFGWTLYQLQMRGMIEGCTFQPPRPEGAGRIMGVMRDNLLLTPRGFEAAEKLLTEDARGRRDRTLTEIWTMLRDAGAGAMAAMIYSWIS